MENQAILKRLQDQPANYNMTKWEEDEQERKKLLKNICEYPYQLESNQTSSIQSNMTSYNSGQPDFIVRT